VATVLGGRNDAYLDRRGITADDHRPASPR
jgi:hypothetical protein